MTCNPELQDQGHPNLLLQGKEMKKKDHRQRIQNQRTCFKISLKPFSYNPLEEVFQENKGSPPQGQHIGCHDPQRPPTGTGWKQRGKYPKFWLSLREVGSPCLSGNPTGVDPLSCVDIQHGQSSQRSKWKGPWALLDTQPDGRSLKSPAIFRSTVTLNLH